MIENLSVSEEERMDAEPDRDMLSVLPLTIIHMILALVPIRDAVRTSILSRKWRYTWASLPHLAFIFEEKFEDQLFEHEKISEYEKPILNSVNHVLFNHKGPIRMFKMSICFRSKHPDIDEWVLRLSRNDIEELILHMGNFGYLSSQLVHSSIYSCEYLTNLVLDNCELDHPPPSTFKGFLFLRSLTLWDVYMSPRDIESFVGGCPVLERLDMRQTFEHEFGVSKLMISSSCLKYLRIYGDYVELSVSAPLLAELWVKLCDNRFYPTKTIQEQLKITTCNYTDFMGGLTNLEKLVGHYLFRMYLSLGMKNCRGTLVVHRLKDIEFDCVNFEEIRDATVVARLIFGAPNLHKLHIQTTENQLFTNYYAPVTPCVSLGDLGCGPDFKLAKLRAVTIKSVRGAPTEVAFIKLLLERSPVLQRMFFSMLPWLGEDEKPKLAAKLRGFGRASPKAELICLDNY